MSEKVIVTIPKHGKVTIEVQGVKGTACKDLTKSLEEALGKVHSDVATGEMFEEEQTSYLNI